MENSIKIYDNFLEKNKYENINKIISGSDFPWFYNEEVTSLNNPKNYLLNNYQFTHLFYSLYSPMSNYFNIIVPILEKINPDCLLRIKANLNPYTENHFEYGMHSDMNVDNDKIFTAIYYVNTNNGHTVFKNGQRIECVSNRMVVFPCKLEHSGVSTTDSKNRILINFNYLFF